MRRNFGLLLMLIGASVVGCTASPTASPSPTMELTSQGNAEQVAEESVVVSESAEAGPVRVEVVGGDEEALREFIRQYVGVSPLAEQVTVRIGELPDDLPVELPLPEGAEVVGSVVTHQSGDESYWSVLVSVPLSADDTEHFYEEAFSGEEWRHSESFQPGGFITNQPQMLFYCYNEDEAFVNIWLTEITDGKTRANISIQEHAGSSPCTDQQGGMRSSDPGQLLPALTAPPGVRQRSGGGGSSGGPGGSITTYQSAELETDLSAAEIADHFNEQLEALGWSRVSAGEQEDAAWSAWTFTDDEGEAWRGNLIIMQSGADNEFFAWISVSGGPDSD